MADIMILVANASRAKFYLSHNLDNDLSLYQEPLEHLQSRARRQDLTTDRNGHYQKNSGEVQGAFAYPTDPKQAEAEKFAIQLAQLLDEGRTHQHFERILLVAPATFTHTLRRHCNKQIAKQIYYAVPKDYTQYSDKQLQRFLSECPRY